MRLAMIGLGRMGGNMARRLLNDGHEIVAHNRGNAAIDKLKTQGAVPAYELEEVIDNLDAPRTVWLMLPSGEPTQSTIERLGQLLEPGDLIVDGGNSRYHDSIARSKSLAAGEVHFCDAGVSGGIWGLENGYCIMVGGAPDDYSRIEPAVSSLAGPGGTAHVGPVGAGHFVKMVHNGIEYAMLQAFAEGFELLSVADEFELNLAQVSELWRHGSVVQSWLLDLLTLAYEQDPELAEVAGYVDDSGEGRWTVTDAIDRGVPLTSVAHSLFARFTSRQEDSYGMKVIAALRKGFGGHATKQVE